MIHVHVAGELVKAPILKTSQSGKTYALLIVKAAEDQICTALAFGEACDEALRLDKGDSVSCVGKLTVGLYERNGVSTPSLSIMTSNLLSGRKPVAKRASAKPASSSVPNSQRVGNLSEPFPEEAGNLSETPF